MINFSYQIKLFSEVQSFFKILFEIPEYFFFKFFLSFRFFQVFSLSCQIQAFSRIPSFVIQSFQKFMKEIYSRF